MLATLTGFVADLRSAGLPVSLTETLDAAAAVTELPIEEKDHLRSALCATLVKSAGHRELFFSLFDVWFADVWQPSGDDATPGGAGRGGDSPEGPTGAETTADPPVVDGDRLALLLRAAIESNDGEELRRVGRMAISRFAGIEPGRPVGASYYLSRTLRGLDLEAVLDGLLESVLSNSPPRDGPDGGGDADLAGRIDGSLRERLLREEYHRRGERLRSSIEADILALLVAERGVERVARSMRRSLVEDIDFMHATRDEVLSLRRAVYPLTRILAARLARRRKHRRRGPLDFRATMRSSLSTGGVPVEPRFRSPRPAKPELVLIADISGSVAAFARFTLHLVYALDAQFSKVRSFVFIDGIDEVTSILRRSSSLAEAIENVASEASVTHRDGHSDYGSALRMFHDRWSREVGARTNVLILGDARNNYHPAEAWVLGELRKRARRLYWLNPEPRSYWGSGDSIVAQYAPHCDAMVECRNLRQLEAFVDELT